MLIAVAVAALASLSPGDSWSVDRTTRYLNVAEELDYTDVDQFDLSVHQVTKHLEIQRRTLETRFEDVVVPTNRPEPERLVLKRNDHRWERVEGDPFGPLDLPLLIAPAAPPVPGHWRSGSFTFSLKGVRGEESDYDVSYLGPGTSGRGRATLLMPERIFLRFDLDVRNMTIPGGTETVDVQIRCQAKGLVLARRQLNK